MAGVGKQRLPETRGSHSTWCTGLDRARGGDPVGARRPRFPSVVSPRVAHMSSLWTPGGERPVGPDPSQPASPAAGPGGPEMDREPTEEEVAAHLDELRQQ